MKKIIGIDLGTTTSAVSIYDKGEVVLIKNKEEKSLTDSAVAMNKFDEIIIGREAKNNINDRIIEIKRKMGTTYKSLLKDKEFSPEEISSKILTVLKEQAEDYLLGGTIDEAVITVPAQFNSFQKMATIKAGELAGLKVERIINEPTAAALAYGVDKLDNEEKILVYDFGGGTFDVSILDFEFGIMDVIGGSGDNHLGGSNIDELLMKHIAYLENLNYKGDTVKENLLKNAIEDAKIELSNKEITKIIIPELNVNTELSLRTFEKLIEGIVDKTMECIDEALVEANVTPEDIKVVLPVGGTSNTPMIQRRLKEKFGEKIHLFEDLQLSVALGAGVQGAIKGGQISHEDGIILTDICAHDLGVDCIGEHQGIMMGGVFSPILRKHSPLPAKNEEVYYTSHDNQERVNMRIYEGKQSLVMENIYIGEMLIDGIPPMKAGEGIIKVEFDYDLNGILNVKATLENTNKVYEGKFEPHKRSQASNEKTTIGYKDSVYYSEYKTTIDIAEKKLETANDVEKVKVETLLNKLKEELGNENKEELDRVDDSLTDLLFEI